MRLCLFLLILLTSLTQTFGQQWSINSTIGTSYSGINHNIRAQYKTGRLSASAGPSFNYSKNKLPWSATPGINIQPSYSLIDSGSIQTQAFVSYLLVPIQNAKIQEVNLGVTMLFKLSTKLYATNSYGFGGYSEKADDFSLSGLSYCINFGLTYRL